MMHCTMVVASTVVIFLFVVEKIFLCFLERGLLEGCSLSGIEKQKSDAPVLCYPVLCMSF